MIKELLPLAYYCASSVRKRVLRRMCAASTYQIVQGLLHEPLVLGVQCRSCLSDTNQSLANLQLTFCSGTHLIQNENGGSLEDCSCERHTLFFSSGEPHTTFSDHSFVTCNRTVSLMRRKDMIFCARYPFHVPSGNPLIRSSRRAALAASLISSSDEPSFP